MTLFPIHHRVRLSRAVSSSIAAGGLLLLPAAMQGQSCKPADATSTRMIDGIVELSTATDPDEAARRSQFGLPAVAASAVTLVLDNNVCAKALAAYVAADEVPGGPQPTSVYVVRVGTGQSARYVVMSPEGRTARSEFVGYVVLDTKFKFVGAYSG